MAPGSTVPLAARWARWTRWTGLASVLLCTLAPGCGVLGEDPRFEPEAGTIEIVETIPTLGELAADPLGRIDVCLSTEIDPSAPAEFDLILRSGRLFFDTRQQVQMFSWRAPGSRGELAASRWCPGSVISVTPGAPLQPGITYRLQIREIPSLGWAGEALATPGPEWTFDPEDDRHQRQIEFRVAGEPGDDPPSDDLLPQLPPGPTLSALFSDGRVFDPTRAACSCHQDSVDDPLARARLDLRDPDTAYAGLVLRDGLESTGYPMVQPRLPAESYLIQKLLRSDDGSAIHALRGDPMPPDTSLPHADLVDLAHWIADGARP